MPLLVHRFDSYPVELETDLSRIYSDSPDFKGLSNDALATIRRDFELPHTLLYAAHFHSRWLAAAIVTGEKDREIRLICVRNMSRQQGVGRKLLNEIKRVELQRGCDSLFTRVESGNPAAQAFLKSLDLQMQPVRDEDFSVCYSLLSMDFTTD